MGAKTARWITVVEGTWLFASVFFWPHTTAQSTNNFAVAVATSVIALIALGAPAVRYVNLAVAGWLIVSAFVLPTLSLATRWNSVTVGLVVGLLSLVRAAPSGRGRGSRPAPPDHGPGKPPVRPLLED
jgi:hypothetical protein